MFEAAHEFGGSMDDRLDGLHRAGDQVERRTAGNDFAALQGDQHLSGLDPLTCIVPHLLAPDRSQQEPQLIPGESWKPIESK